MNRHNISMGRLMAALIMILAGISAISCSTKEPEEPSFYRNVVVLYTAGYNNLSGDIETNIANLKEGYVPDKSSEDVILVLSKLTAGYGDYRTPTPAELQRIYTDRKGQVQTETIMSWEDGTLAASSATVNDVLKYIMNRFRASSYGMIFSSHATGWLPKGYYANGKIQKSASPASVDADGFKIPEPVDLAEPEPENPDWPRVKSLGADYYLSSRTSYEMEIEDFANAIPMELDYIIMDACFMGSVECAYALREKCHYLISSPTEVLSYGLVNYSTVTSRLFSSSYPDLTGICQDSYDYYNSLSGLEQSLTVSLTDCYGLDRLAEVSAGIFAKYAQQLADVNPDSIQKYYRFSSKHWFYDMRDILEKSGVSEDDLAEFDEALDDCIMYKAATPAFINLQIRNTCGLSMFLPADSGDSELDDFYRTLSWNEATGLVE